MDSDGIVFFCKMDSDGIYMIATWSGYPVESNVFGYDSMENVCLQSGFRYDDWLQIILYKTSDNLTVTQKRTQTPFRRNSKLFFDWNTNMQTKRQQFTFWCTWGSSIISSNGQKQHWRNRWNNLIWNMHNTSHGIKYSARVSRQSLTGCRKYNNMLTFVSLVTALLWKCCICLVDGESGYYGMENLALQNICCKTIHDYTNYVVSIKYVLFLR